MSKKKRFGISEALTRGLSETIHVVENNAGVFRNIVLPLSRIELDPENPRKLAINLPDVRLGLQENDPLYTKKSAELDKLKELAHTIKSSGVINPIIVYKLGEVYRIVAGERRCLASIIAGKQEIEARVFNEKPKGFELKLVQWIENTSREDLTLDERLGNMREIIHEYQAQHHVDEVNATSLKNITGLSLPQCSYYLAVLNAPKDLQLHISNGTIRNLDKAAVIANIESDELRSLAIQACLNGTSLKGLRNIVTQKRLFKKHQHDLKTPASGRSTSKILMGSTTKTSVIQVIVQSVLAQNKFDHYRNIFEKVSWQDSRQASKAFKKLVEIMEMEVAV